MRTVFHVSTAAQLSYVDVKVHNLLADETVEIEDVAVVVDVPDAINAAAGPCRENAESVLQEGGAFAVCSNAARGATRVDELPDGVEIASSGVGELTRLQNEGYAYIRP